MSVALAAEAAALPVLSWEDFRRSLRWRQGEHVALVGPTGQGKTTLGLQLVDQRGWVVLIVTKAQDDTVRPLLQAGWKLTRSWPPDGQHRRVILWPRFKRMTDKGHQQAVIAHALGEIFVEGGWCVFVDDVQYMTDVLGLGAMLRMIWYQARSLGLSLVAATQRPRRVPVEMWSQSRHVFIWSFNSDDLKTVSELGKADTKLVKAAVQMLPDHHALYADTRDGRLAVTKAERRVAA